MSWLSDRLILTIKNRLYYTKSISKMKRILFFLFIFLFAILLIEGGYLYFAKSQKTGGAAFSPSPSTARVTSVQQAVARNAQIFSEKVEKGLVTASEVTNVYEGLIGEIDLDGGRREDTGETYAVKLTIYNDKDEMSLYFYDQDLDKITVLKKTAEKEETIALEDLRPDYYIRIKGIFDIVNSYRLKELVITQI